MGYMGFGLQKWIYNLKPRRPFKKRVSKLGYETIDLGSNRKQFNDESVGNKLGTRNSVFDTKNAKNAQSKLGRNIIIVAFALIIFLTAFYVIQNKSSNSINKDFYTIEEYDIKDKEKDVIALYLKSGVNLLRWNQIEAAQEKFELALEIDPENIEILKFYVMALSLDCERNNKNCDKAVFYFNKMKGIDENKIPIEINQKIEKIKKTNR
jgi:tetratricopeptide (TPR) repeat protein